MLLFVAAVAALAAALLPRLIEAFTANPALNGLIVAVLALGIIYLFLQVLGLYREAAWIESIRAGQTQPTGRSPPRMLAPMAAMLGERKGPLSLSAPAMRSLMDGISARLDDSRDMSRYLVGLLIFLGLLGTFWGLLQTIGSVGQVISGLETGPGDMNQMFAKLKSGLQAPLGGMATAFSSSLFGLTGSLVLGFLEMQAGQAQNRFYNEFEDWLSAQTRLSSSSLVAEGDQGVPAYVQALLEQTAVSLENLQRTLVRGEDSRVSANVNIAELADKVGTLTDQMRTEQSLMMRLAENQVELRSVLSRLADSGVGRLDVDDGMRSHVRNLDLHLSRLMEELEIGRSEMIGELRNEIRMLSRTLAAIAEKPGRAD